MITLSDFGSFHIGGRRVEVTGKPVRTIHFTPTTSHAHDPNGTFLIEPAYVQYFVPEPRRHALPVLLIHGGGMTGANWETTPDGRAGWLHRFLAAGFATYVIDNVERGRAGWCALDGEWQGEPVIRSLEQAWDMFRFGRPGDFAARKPFAAMQFPLGALDDFGRQFVPRWTTNDAAQKAAILATLERIGPCIVVCHSQGGELSLDTVAQHPDLVRHAVALEPSGFPDVAAAPHLADQHWLFVMGDNIEASPFWVGLMERTRDTVGRLTAAGSDATLLHLPEAGMPGNSHMLMMDLNSAEIAARVIDWLVPRL